MSSTLDIVSVGAVTPIGLDARQTAASFRARIAGFEMAIVLPPPEEPLRAARVPAHRSLRSTPRDWLVNLAARAIREALRYRQLRGRLGLILTLPDRERNHPAMVQSSTEHLAASIGAAAGTQVFERIFVAGHGGAGIAPALSMAGDLTLRGDVDACVVGGVDSLVNADDVERFRQAGRILEPGNPKGLIPGEGAAMLFVAPVGRFSGSIARLCGSGFATETDSVWSPRLSQGRGFERALQAAVASSGSRESAVAFRVSTMNGEHYAVWESMFITTRYYRTRRETFPVWYTATSVGDVGAASGAISLVLAALGIAGGYAPGPYAMCESASEDGLRGACLVGPAAEAPIPPFRPEEGSAQLILGKLEFSAEVRPGRAGGTRWQ